MKKILSLLALLLISTSCFNAEARKMQLLRNDVGDLTTLSAASVDAAADYIPVWDASDREVKKVLAAGASTYTTTASAAELNYVDITTLGTAQASKVLTFDSSLDSIIPTGGLITFQSGAGLTLDSGSALTVEAVVVNKKALSLAGRATIKICGDATTVNNNTVYYGPSQVVAAGGLQTCNIAAAGSATEATADAPALDATAFQVLSMNCYVTDPGATVSFTLRSAAGATTPSMTCSIADNGNDCHTNAGTTTAIASGATVAIAAASSADMGTAQFVCELNVAY